MTDAEAPDDAALIAELDAARSDAWRTLAALDADLRAVPHRDDDCVWQTPDGQMPFPAYGTRINAVRRALAEVGAVTPLYPWPDQQPPSLDADGRVSAADAVRLATRIVRSERFADGSIGAALDDGTLHAVVAALVAWHRAAER